LKQKLVDLELALGKNGTSDIRLRYSGLIVFTTQLLGVVTGLVFTLLLTRSMTTTEYGLWTNIFDYTPYFLLVSIIIPFWVTRFTARDIEGTVITSTISQLVLGVIATVAYLPIITAISFAIGTSQYLTIYLIAGFYVLTHYMITVFEGALTATKPHATGYGFIIQEIVKVIVALIIILGFGQIFLGAILALVIAPTVQSFYYIYKLRHFFREKINWHYVKRWLRSSPVLLYNVLGTQILNAFLILLYIYGGGEARAFYQAALSFTTVVSYASSLAIALYPKLLANSCSKEDIKLSFKTVMMLAIPLATIVMTMSVSFLTVLDTAYAASWPVLIALTVDTLLTMLILFYSSILMGVENFDAAGEIHLKKLVRSKIFKLFSIPYIQSAFALPAVYLVLTQLNVDGPVITTAAVVAVMILVHLFTFVALAIRSRHSIHVPIAWTSIAKYVFAAFITGAALVFIPTTTTLVATVAKAAVGFGIYAVILLAIDEQARELIRLIWQEIKTNINQLLHRDAGDNEAVPAEN
jgi:O-antigen/teichoic acid export membrane protein